MIWVDGRTGSKELLPLIQRQGVPASLVKLDAADFAFEGNGPDGAIQVGVERKALGDLIGSLLDGRLQGLATPDGGGQLGRLQATYDYAWLLVEGLWAVNETGQLCRRGSRGRLRPLPGGLTEDALQKRLLSLELQGGLHVKHTTGKQQTATWLASLYRWWTDKTWNQHQTLAAVHRPRTMMPLSLFREMTLPLPRIGLQGTKALERTTGASFGKLFAMSGTELAEMQISTPAGPRRLGASKATELAAALDKLR